MNYNKIIILGSKGMLGQMVFSYFNKMSFNVVKYDKYFEDSNFEKYVNELNSFEDSIVINCIGRIKQKSINSHELLWSNTILPIALLRSLKSTHLLIHPSTDCVFSGKITNTYDIDHVHDANDVYGWSKSLGESAIKNLHNSIILRVSIIGPDKNSNKGLLSWFLNNQKGSILNGFSDHFWNGITTLEWCKQLKNIVEDSNLLKDCIEKKIIQLGTKTRYSKLEMLKIFNNIYEKNFIINDVKSNYTNRCLNPMIISKSLELQMKDLIEFEL
jgi:dTDP-4-dehydrorhamnose reductase